MVLLLPGDVVADVVDLRGAYRKGAIPALPVKPGIPRVHRLHPFRRMALELPNQIGYRGLAGEAAEDAGVILDAADHERWALLVRTNPVHVPVEAFAVVLVLEEGALFLRGEDDVDEEVAEGLCHLFHPFRVCVRFVPYPG